MRVSGKLLATVTVATALTLGIVGAGRAQDATPMSGMEAMTGYPNHFHMGTCDELNPQPAVVLADLMFPGWVGELTSDATAASESTIDVASFGGAAIPVAVATTEIELSLADIVAGGHALNVHDAADPAIYIACGNVGGLADERGDMFFGLAEQNDSGFSGTAWLHDNGGSTTVTVFLNHNAAQDEVTASLSALQAAAAAAATPMASPTEEAAATPAADVAGTPVTT